MAILARADVDIVPAEAIGVVLETLVDVLFVLDDMNGWRMKRGTEAEAALGWWHCEAARSSSAAPTVTVIRTTSDRL